jgi:hypothetical protein
MPRAPRDNPRPVDVIGKAIMVARIATDEIEDAQPPRRWQRPRREGARGEGREGAGEGHDAGAASRDRA